MTRLRGPAVRALVAGIITLVPALVLPTAAQAQEEGRPIEGLFRAFNAHDAEAMGTFASEDVEVIYVSDAGVSETGTRGRSELVSQMRAYFEALPDVASRIEEVIEGPVYTSVRERIVDGAASLAVYEVRDGLIRRVWYFPVDGPPAQDGGGRT